MCVDSIALSQTALALLYRKRCFEIEEDLSVGVNDSGARGIVACIYANKAIF
jgi:hypothetical protein